jgi:serine/threonine protein kinase/WD40 repeat protein
MSDPSLERIEELFHRAVDLNPEQRAAFLEIECAGDAKLKSAVLALLAHDQVSADATDFLASPVHRPVRSNDAATHKAEPADQSSSEVPENWEDFSPIIPGYEILEELGRGGMGVVYKARQTGLNRIVALKMLLSIGPVSPEDFARFRVEAESLAQLHHPNIVQIFEIGEHEGLPFFVMEYIEGPSLAQQTGGVAQRPLVAAHIVEILARAMAAVHERGIIHRDLKPANILLQGPRTPAGREKGTQVEGETRRLGDKEKEKQGQRTGSLSLPVSPSPGLLVSLSECVPKITDFGLAKRLESSGAATKTGTVIGTPWYMPPEQARGDISGLGPWTDLYSLGAILYELLTGRPPIQDESPALTLMKVLSDEPLPPSRWRPDLPRDLNTICLKLLEKDPQRRYASAVELAEDLRRYQAGEPIKARPIGMLERTWRWCRRQPLTAAALTSTAILGLGLIITVLVFNSRLRESLAREKRLAEDRRGQLIQLHVSIGVRELDSGDAFTALVWLAEALRLDEENADHRLRILQILEHVPWLIKVEICDGDVLASRFTANNCWLAAACPDRSVRIWDVNRNTYIGPRLEHTAAVVLAEFSPDGQYLATASADGALRLWRLDNGESDLISPATVEQPGWLASTRTPRSQFKRLMFNPNGRVLVTQTADDTVHAWLIENGKHISFETFTGDKGTILSSDGKFAFSLDPSGNERLWEPTEIPFTKVQLEILHAGIPSALSADGRYAALVDDKKTVRIAETATGKIRGNSLAHTHPVLRVMFTPQGDHILTVDATHVARLWRYTTHDQPIMTVSTGSLEGIVPFTQFSLNGRFLAALGSDDRLRVWEVATHKQATPPLHPRVPLQYESISPDGSRLLVVGKDHTVRLWDLSPCGSEIRGQGSGLRGQEMHAIQPGLNKEFTASQLSALVAELAGVRLDEQERLVPLDEAELLAIWQRWVAMRSSE